MRCKCLRRENDKNVERLIKTTRPKEKKLYSEGEAGAKDTREEGR